MEGEGGHGEINGSIRRFDIFLGGDFFGVMMVIGDGCVVLDSQHKSVTMYEFDLWQFAIDEWHW